MKKYIDNLLDTCHFLEMVNAYVLGKISLSELRSFTRCIQENLGVNLSDKEKYQIIQECKRYMAYKTNLTSMDISYLTGIHIADVIRIEKEFTDF